LFGEDRVLPFANVYPGYEEQKQADYLEELGKGGMLFGLKLHTLAIQQSAIKLHNSPFLQVARSYSLPVLIHSGTDQISYPQNVVELARNNRDIRFCIAHVGRFEKKVFDSLNDGDTNIFFDTSPFLSIAKVTPLDIDRGIGGERLNLPYEDPTKALEVLCRMFPERMMWGSDEPYTTMTVDREGGVLMKVYYQDEVNLLNSLPSDLRAKIAHDNTIRFLFGNQ
jgi:predicted TIM-barrel fold metal-dependent hydrolase